MIKLYIGGKPVDIDASTSVNLTYQFEDLYNPTGIKNTYSKTVTIPATDRNNALFDNIWSLSHKVADFNPSKRVDFVLTDSNSVIEAGYVKLDSVQYDGHLPGSYSVSLSGQRGNFFYSLESDQKAEDEKDAQLTLDNLNVDNNNYNHPITAEEVRKSFTNEYYRYILSYSGQYDNFDADKVFDSFDDLSSGIRDMAFGNGMIFLLGAWDKYYISEDNGVNFTEYTAPNEVYLWHMTGVEFDSITNSFIVYGGENGYSVGGGLIGIPIEVAPHAYFSYTSNPKEPSSWTRSTFGTWSNGYGKLKALSILPSSTNRRYAFVSHEGYYLTGNTLSGKFTASKLPEATTIHSSKNKVAFSRVIGSTGESGFIAADGPVAWVIVPVKQSTAITKVNPSSVVKYITGGCLSPAISSDYYYLFTGSDGYWGYVTNIGRSNYIGSGLISGTSFIPLGITAAVGNYMYVYGTEGKIYAINITSNSFNVSTASGNTLPSQTHNNIYKLDYDSKSGRWFALVKNTTGQARFAYSTDAFRTWKLTGGTQTALDTEEMNEHQRNEFRASYQRPCLRLKHIITQILEDSDYTYELKPEFFSDSNPYWEKTWLVMRRLEYDGDVPADHAGNVRSGDDVTFRMMVTKGISRLKMLTDFLKTFGLIITLDKTKKHVVIQTRNEYFSGFRIVDWTAKQDYSSKLSIKPLTFNYKYGIFKYSDGGSHYEKLYKEKYKRDYGYARVNTGFEFNNTEKNYIDSNVFTNLVMSTEYDREFEGRHTYDKFADDKILPALFTKSGDEMSYNDSSMHLVFIDGLTTLKKPVRITDDNIDMLNSNLYMWNNSTGNTETVTQIPNVKRVLTQDGVSYSLDFARPQELYYRGSYPNGIGLYDRKYKAYVEERLSVDNKDITGNFHITDSDMATFGFNNFIRILNNLWHPVVVTDFKVDGTGTTKTQLVRVRNTDSYTKGQY